MKCVHGFNNPAYCTVCCERYTQLMFELECVKVLLTNAEAERNAARFELEEEKKMHENSCKQWTKAETERIRLHQELIREKEMRSSENERCAKICELMIVGGRAWTKEQAVAAEVLFAAAENIRKLPVR